MTSRLELRNAEPFHTSNDNFNPENVFDVNAKVIELLP